MLIKESALVQEALDNSDLDQLKSLVKVQSREINPNTNFKSPLMLSAHKLKHLNKIPELTTDAIILNLEDGVSQEMKPFALSMVMLTLNALQKSDKTIIVRVNALDEGGVEEIALLNAFRPDAIRVPKVKTPEDVETILGLCDEEIAIHLSIETKEAWLNLEQLKTSPRVQAFYLGILDLFADMKLSQALITVENPLIHQILARFLLTSKAVGVKPISFVYQEYQNKIGFQKWLDLEKQMGFDAKGCLSPKQVAQTQATFGLDAKERARAEHIVKAFELQQSKGVTGFSDEKYGFIDEPIYKGALALLKGA